MPFFAFRRVLLLSLGSILLLTGCTEDTTRQSRDAASADTMATEDTTSMSMMRSAAATLSPTEGHEVRGTVTFTEVDEGVRVVARVQGLSEGEHGFHIHENGDCSAADASSAGGHFAPEGSPHGRPTDSPSERHTGDLGNLEANAEGVARYERVDTLITLGEGSNSIVDRAVIIHEQPDSFGQPAGNAGPRLACGVIMMEGAGGAAARTDTSTALEAM